jgi:histidinol-phosphate/aromatic aminotransferase/cobyric acid decarboxylase-like protein
VIAYKPQANFVLCRLPDGGPTAPEVAKRMFVRSNLFVKHCSGKAMPDGGMYLRLANRTPPENATLVEALRSCIQS